MLCTFLEFKRRCDLPQHFQVGSVGTYNCLDVGVARVHATEEASRPVVSLFPIDHGLALRWQLCPFGVAPLFKMKNIPLNRK